MSGFGGGVYKQSYLISSGTSRSQTQVIEQSRSPPNSDRSSSYGPYSQEFRSVTPPAVSNPPLRRVHAAEAGDGSLLPNFTRMASSEDGKSNTKSSRIRTLSDINQIHRNECDSPTQDGGLRRRGTLSLDDDSSDSTDRTRSISSPYHSMHSRARGVSPSGPHYGAVPTKKGFTIWTFFQAFLLVVVLLLVYDAHSRVQQAAGRLENYKQEEVVLIHQMDRIEDRAKQLQEQLKRLREQNVLGGSQSIETTKAKTEDIHDELHKWKREYFEVNKEVHALQDFMKDDARHELQQRYGKDAIRVNLDLNFGKEPVSQISVELFEEAPHASWVFVQQIENGDWSSASFIWHPAHMVLATSTKAASVKLEFVEKTYHHHEAWTVGLTKSHNGGYNLYVNLQENSHVHEGDACIGKVVGGFDTLQKLMHLETVAKTPGSDKFYLQSPVAINQFTITTGQRRRRY